jgi:AcrR family transcriptional regulator
VGTSERRERERRQRREAILAAARDLFWTRGYAATTMPRIARAAELAPGTLYLYFPGKGAIYAELLMEGFDRLIERLGAEVASTEDPRDEAGQLIDAFLGFARDYPQYFDIIFFVMQRETPGTRESALDEARLKRLRAKEDACKALAARALQRAPRLRSADDSGATIDAIWSMLVGLVFYFRKTGDETFARVAARAKELLLDATFGTK